MDKLFKSQGAENLKKFLLSKKEEGLLTNDEIGELLGVEGNNISKIIRGYKSGVKAESFFKVFKAFEERLSSFSEFVEEIYPGLLVSKEESRISSLKNKQRNNFGAFMNQFEVNSNSMKEISVISGISMSRLNQLYFLSGALQAYELILIEKAIGKKPGELFELYFGNNEPLK